MKRCLLLLLYCFVSTCWGADDQDTTSWKHPEPISYASLRAWHKAGGLAKYPWTKEHHKDLNDDNTEEVFLGTIGWSRGMCYALCTKTSKGWILISEEIEGSTLGFIVLPAKHGEWHDFEAYLPSGRGDLIGITYTWNGRHYVRKSYRDVTKKELLGD